MSQYTLFQRRSSRFALLSISDASQFHKGKAIPVTGRGGPEGCETSRLPYFVENGLTDGGEVK
jgi:hypothetical protein